MARKYIDDHICLITAGDGDKIKQSSNGVIIWAHGTQLKNKKFHLPGGLVRFYCPDGYALQSTFYNFVTEEWVIQRSKTEWDFIGPIKVPDYQLTKAISYHIIGHYTKKIHVPIIERHIREGEAEGKGEATYDYLEKFISSGRCQYDIASIRNRWNSKGTTLGHVVGKLRSEGFGYGNIYCHHCRAAKDYKIWSVDNDWDEPSYDSDDD